MSETLIAEIWRRIPMYDIHWLKLWDRLEYFNEVEVGLRANAIVEKVCNKHKGFQVRDVLCVIRMELERKGSTYATS